MTQLHLVLLAGRAELRSSLANVRHMNALALAVNCLCTFVTFVLCYVYVTDKFCFKDVPGLNGLLFLCLFDMQKIK